MCHILLTYKILLTLALQAQVKSLEKKLEESNKRSEEHSKHASEAETKIIEMKMAMQRFF